MEAERQAGDSQSWKAKGDLGCINGILHQTVSRLPVANQVFLGSWMVDICQEGCSQRSAPRGSTGHIWDGVLVAHRETVRLGPGTWLRCTTSLGQCTRQAVVTWATRTCKGHKMHAQPILCLCGVLENPNLTSLDLENAQNPGPTLDSSLQSNLEPEQCRPGKHTHRELGKPSVVHTLQALPTHASNICLQCSSLPTAQLNKWA